MSCESCENSVGRSHSGSPFVPPNRSCNDIQYVCDCGQIWFQYNPHYHLWQEATPEEWEGWKKALTESEPD